MLIRRLLISFIAFHLLVHPAFADMIMLRDGQRHLGVVANREDVRAHPEEHLYVSILPKDSTEPLRFPVEDIEFVVFQDGEDQQIIDFKALTARADMAQKRATVAGVAGVDSKGGGFGIIAAGLAAAGIGIFVKFGEEQTASGSSSFGRSEKSYNAVNYALIGLGAMLVAVGTARQWGSTKWLSHDADGLMIGCKANQGERRVAVGYRVTF